MQRQSLIGLKIYAKWKWEKFMTIADGDADRVWTRLYTRLCSENYTEVNLGRQIHHNFNASGKFSLFKTLFLNSSLRLFNCFTFI